MEEKHGASGAHIQQRWRKYARAATDTRGFSNADIRLKLVALWYYIKTYPVKREFINICL